MFLEVLIVCRAEAMQERLQLCYSLTSLGLISTGQEKRASLTRVEWRASHVVLRIV